MTTTTSWRRAMVGLLVAMGLLLLGSPANAAPGADGVPPAVAQWFVQDAPRVAGDVLGQDAVNLGPGQPVGTYAAGSPVRLHDWNPQFVAGTSSQVAVPSDEWVAALYRNGTVVGTIAATSSPAGQIALSYLDDDAAAGQALASGARLGDVVQDLRMGGLLEVAPNGVAKGLSAVAASRLTTGGSVTALQKTVRDAHDSKAWGAADSAGSGGGGTDRQVDHGTRLWLGAAVGMAGLVLLVAGNRSQRRKRTVTAG